MRLQKYSWTPKTCTLDQRSRVLHHHWRQHAQLTQLIITLIQTLNRIDEARKAEIPRLIRAQTQRQSPRGGIAERKVRFNILEWIVRHLVLRHDLFPRLVILRLCRPIAEREEEARFRCWTISIQILS